MLTRDLFAVANLIGIISADDVVKRREYCDHFLTMRVGVYVTTIK